MSANISERNFLRFEQLHMPSIVAMSLESQITVTSDLVLLNWNLILLIKVTRSNFTGAFEGMSDAASSPSSQP